MGRSRQTKDAHEYVRVAAMNMVRIKELDASFTADVLCIDRRTFNKWLDAYDHYGLDGLADTARPDRPPPLRAARQTEKDCWWAKQFTVYKFVRLDPQLAVGCPPACLHLNLWHSGAINRPERARAAASVSGQHGHISRAVGADMVK